MIRVSSCTVARLVRSRITARAVTDLPDPLSPTSATGLALVQPERHVAHGLDMAAVDLEGHADIARVDQRGHGARSSFGACCAAPQYGSIASRRPSPSALNANTVSSTKPTGDRIQG